MILRRVIKHFRNQEWTAIFLDFIIVVVGVFVGLQVSNWNAARADDERATAYLGRIHADLMTDVANYKNRLEFWGQVSDHGLAGLAYAKTDQTGGLTYWEMLLDYFQASQVAEFNSTQTTYDELTSAGELGLIANVDIRTAISDYYTNVGNATLTERPAYREHIRGVIPIAVQTYIWDNCYSSDSSGGQVMLVCEAPIDQQRAEEIVTAIASNDDLMSELRYWMSTMKIATFIGGDRVELAHEMMQLIEMELGIERGEQAP